jgi:diguanylate cyclase (GGDEF)-like protein
VSFKKVMSSKKANLLLLLAIVLTLLLTHIHGLLPRISHVVLPNKKNTNYSVNGSLLPSGEAAATWLDGASRSYRCIFPDNFTAPDYFCGFYLQLNPLLSKGMNLSRFDKIKIDINYLGGAKKVRVFLRNYNTAYSVTGDNNSLKFNAASFDVKETDTLVEIDLNDFAVADWWLAQYNISKSLSQPDFRNIVVIGIDFADNKPPVGNHDFQIRSITLEGRWISRENWYLLIIYLWIFGVFIYAIYCFIILRKKNQHDLSVMYQLHEKNDLLRSEKDGQQKLSTVDSLTNTYNRFGVDQIINTLMSISHDSHKETDVPFYSLVLIDIDHFKRVNERRGYDVGDRILQQVATLIKNTSRAQDFVARWGGEEFLVIMPNTDKHAGIALAEKVRSAISKIEFEPQVPLLITISAGICERLDNEDFASAFKRVDKALYKAKQQGRNCCSMASDSIETFPPKEPQRRY